MTNWENPNQAALLLYNTIQKHTNDLNYSWEVSWNFWTASLSIVENRLFGRKQNDSFPRGSSLQGAQLGLHVSSERYSHLGCFCWTHHLWIHVHFYHWSTVSRCVNYFYFPYYSTTCGCSIHKIWIEHNGLASRRHCNDGFDMFRYMENYILILWILKWHYYILLCIFSKFLQWVWIQTAHSKCAFFGALLGRLEVLSAPWLQAARCSQSHGGQRILTSIRWVRWICSPRAPDAKWEMDGKWMEKLMDIIIYYTPIG